MENFWGFDVWGGFLLVAVLLVSLLLANGLKKSFKFLQVSLIPTSVLAGLILLLISGVYSGVTGESIFDAACFGGNGAAALEIITYHALALGFIATALKSSDKKLTKERNKEIFNTGVTTVSTYLLQGVLGLGITMIAALVIDGFFPRRAFCCRSGTDKARGRRLITGVFTKRITGSSGAGASA